MTHKVGKSAEWKKETISVASILWAANECCWILRRLAAQMALTISKPSPSAPLHPVLMRFQQSLDRRRGLHFHAGLGSSSLHWGIALVGQLCLLDSCFGWPLKILSICWRFDWFWVICKTWPLVSARACLSRQCVGLSSASIRARPSAYTRLQKKLDHGPRTMDESFWPLLSRQLCCKS